ncbi:MAG: GNAT family N-acetyltransferase [Burkholderiales bacterium]
MSGRPETRLVTGDWAALRADASPVRIAVFVDEQRFPLDEEFDAHDAASLHAVAYDGTRPVATGRLLPDARIGRMAVLPAHRGGGVGGRLLERLVCCAAERGDREVTLSSQVRAIGFYERHGFVAEGPEYDDTGVPHRTMRRRLG